MELLIDPRDVENTYSFSWPDSLTCPIYGQVEVFHVRLKELRVLIEGQRQWEERSWEDASLGSFPEPVRCFVLEEALTSAIDLTLFERINEVPYTYLCYAPKADGPVVVSALSLSGDVEWSTMFNLVPNGPVSRSDCLAGALIMFDIENHERIRGFYVDEEFAKRYY